MKELLNYFLLGDKMIDKNIYLKNILKKEGKKYDVAVMYSGGKDSAYLLYLLKYIYHKRVLAITVDNGFEKQEQWPIISEYCQKNDVDHIILKPDFLGFKALFKTLIVENEYFKKEGINHVCFICNNFLWMEVCKYASLNDIPYVASGLSLEQLSSGRKDPLIPNQIANAIAQKSTQYISYNALVNLKKTNEYQNNIYFKNFIDKYVDIKNVTTIYPFIYHEISVSELKNTISLYGWNPPSNIKRDDYISSGCKIMSIVIPELEKLGLVTINERMQNKRMIEKGLLDKKYSNYSNLSSSSINLDNSLFDELDIKNYLIKL